MSREDAQAFLKRLEQDAAVHQAASKAAEARDADRLIAIGAEHGLRFTTGELDEACNEQRFGPGTRELNDAQLEGVAGGWYYWFTARIQSTIQKNESDTKDAIIRHVSG